MTAEIYLVDLGQRMLSPLPPTESDVCTVDGTLAGRAFELVEIVAATDPDGSPVLWVPMLDGTERLGVVRVGLSAGADPEDAELRRNCCSGTPRPRRRRRVRLLPRRRHRVLRRQDDATLLMVDWPGSGDGGVVRPAQ